MANIQAKLADLHASGAWIPPKPEADFPDSGFSELDRQQDCAFLPVLDAWKADIVRRHAHLLAERNSGRSAGESIG